MQRGGGAADPQEQPELRRAGEALLPPHLGRSVPAVGVGKSPPLPFSRGGEGQGGEEQPYSGLPARGPGVPGWPGCPLAGPLPFVGLFFFFFLFALCNLGSQAILGGMAKGGRVEGKGIFKACSSELLSALCLERVLWLCAFLLPSFGKHGWSCS